jgi:hypothetical protein
MKLRPRTMKRYYEETPVKKTKKENDDDDEDEDASMMGIDSPARTASSSASILMASANSNDTKILLNTAAEDDEMGLILEIAMADERVAKALDYEEEQDEESAASPSSPDPMIIMKTTNSATDGRGDDDSPTDQKTPPASMEELGAKDDDQLLDSVKTYGTKDDQSSVKTNVLTERKKDSARDTQGGLTNVESAAAESAFFKPNNENDEDDPELASHNDSTFSSSFETAMYCLPESAVQLGAHEHSAFVPYTPSSSSSPRTTTATYVCCKRCEKYWTDLRKKSHVLFKLKKMLDDSSSSSANESLYGWSANGRSFELVDRPQTNAILAEIMGSVTAINAIKRLRGRLCTYYTPSL